MMDADLRSQPLRLLDPTTMLTMVISLVLMYHTWILHHDGGWPLKLASEASGPNHNAYHVVIIGFHVSHLVIASWWWPTSKVSLQGQWIPSWCLPCWHHWFWCVTLGYWSTLHPPLQVLHDVLHNVHGGHWDHPWQMSIQVTRGQLWGLVRFGHKNSRLVPGWSQAGPIRSV